MLNLNLKQKLVDSLYKSGAITFTKSKNPDSLPYEIKLQYLTSQPKTLRFVAELLWSSFKDETFDLIAGPYTDIPLATTVSLEYNWPMIFIRGQKKQYGMGKLIEGNYKTDQKVIVIDEEVRDPADTLQILGRLEGSGLNIVGLYVLIDRGLGGIDLIKSKGYKCEALINLNDIFIHLLEMGKISPDQLNQTKDYFKAKKVSSCL
jgi:orotate phosphoribosyltransferase